VSGEPGRHARPLDSSMLRVIAEVMLALIGGALVVCAIAANQQWLDRHFLPSFFIPRHWYVLIEASVRIALAAAGVALAVIARTRVGRLAARNPLRVFLVIVAVILAIGASELALSHLRPSSAHWLVPDEEPRRRADPRLGWSFEPSRTGQKAIGGRVIDYAFDSSGYRVRRADQPVDPARPTILFSGESVMDGDGLTWEESVPARVGAMLAVQSANLAVDGFSTDQAYLRLQTELPRFRQPVAVVALFMTALFGRNLDDDRPHLGPGLVWLPAVPRGRVVALAKLLVPYRRAETVERGIAVTREVLSATIALAAARGATALIVVPQLGAEDQIEQTLRHRILDETGLPYVFVKLDANWRLPGNMHPNARAASVIAAAVADRLRSASVLPRAHSN
jgi:hypothetical protein